MNKSKEQLLKSFKKIKSKGWVESLRKGPTGIGYTFEQLLSLPENNLSIPDYNEIEIKTKRFYTKGNITLFSTVPDGDEIFPLKKLCKNFGYPDKEFPQFNILNISIQSNNYTNIGIYKKFKLKINNSEKKIQIEAINNQKIDNSTSWSYELLEKTLTRKISYLAIVKAHSKFYESKEFFKYSSIKFYKLKDFDTFIRLLEKGIIRLTIKIGIHKTHDRLGQIKCHGCSFDIHENNIEQLFLRIE